ncbi:hypothetical protein B0H14DRAFT_2559560 [Mycena olivaceomarginata]|nr:hypothetical protein B0H14DRAFT_2559560 [Mycena olivaceomarginata]
MSIDFVADHTNLSVVTYPGESTKHILFGPILCAYYRHVRNDDPTNRAISQGEQLFIDYGREYWEDTQSPVKCLGHVSAPSPGCPARPRPQINVVGYELALCPFPKTHSRNILQCNVSAIGASPPFNAGGSRYQPGRRQLGDVRQATVARKH